MATIHHSRMALIQGQGSANHAQKRSPSPGRRRRSLSPNRTNFNRSRENGRTGDRAGDATPDSREQSTYSNDRQDRVRGRDTTRDRDRSGYTDRRRASPQYDDYNRTPALEPQDLGPWRQPQNMYPNCRDRPPHHGGGSDFMESRRLQRENQTASVWPSSPKAPARELSPKRNKSSKKSKRPRSLSSSSEEQEERRPRERKERKRSRKDNDRDHENRRRHRSRSRSRSRRHKNYDHSDDDSQDDSRRRRRNRERSKSDTRSRSRSLLPRTSEGVDESEWVVKTSMPPPPIPIHAVGGSKSDMSSAITRHAMDDDSDEEVGPQPLVKINTRKVDERSYGGALLRGEGSAMAAFLQEGTEARIPRRGEIGLTPEEIATFEDVGYVMSGSRHRRMNAVRIRKENQVISAEEKRGILKLQKEERTRREAILREEFSELVNERLKGVSDTRPPQ